MGTNVPENREKGNEIGPVILQHVDLERALLGAALLDESGALLARLRREMRPEEISSEAYREIFAAMCEVADAENPINPHWIEDALRRQGTHERAFGRLADIMNGNIRITDPSREIAAIKKAYHRRKVSRIFSGLATQAQDPQADLSDLLRQGMDAIGAHTSEPARPLALSWGDLSMLDIPAGEQILHATQRGELVMTAAVTNRGKTTLWRNVALSLACGRPFYPIAPEGRARKVLYLDFETRLKRIRDDLTSMIGRLSTKERVATFENLYVVADAEIDGRTLDLSIPRHVRAIEEKAREIGADVIIIDTLTAAFAIANENDNSEASHICKTLIGMARRLNCVVVFLHHVGKQKMEEGQASEAVHRGRGGSAYAGFAHSILNILADKTDPNLVTVECAKSKGQKFEAEYLRLNQASRWFEATGRVERAPSSLEKVVSVFNGKPLSTAEVLKLLPDIPERSVKNYLKEAVDRGDLKREKQGVYVKVQECKPYRVGTSCTFSEPPEGEEDSGDYVN